LKLIEIKTGVKSHILRHLGAVLIKLHRTDISPRNDKLTNGRVVNHTKVQLIHLGMINLPMVNFKLYLFYNNYEASHTT